MMPFLIVAGLGVVATPVHWQDDEKVVEATMLAVYTDRKWTDRSWQKGEVVLVAPGWRPTRRPSFAGELRQILASSQNPWEMADLRQILSKEAGEPKQVPPPMPLRDMIIDPRIRVGVLSERERGYGWFGGEASISTPNGPKTVRVPFSLSPPAYSQSGRYASIRGWAPWSIHPAEVRFYLVRKGAGWKVFRVDPAFYI